MLPTCHIQYYNKRGEVHTLPGKTFSKAVDGGRILYTSTFSCNTCVLYYAGSTIVIDDKATARLSIDTTGRDISSDLTSSSPGVFRSIQNASVKVDDKNHLARIKIVYELKGHGFY